MYTTDFNELMATPFLMAVTALVMVVLMALTMRSVIKRQRAMIREPRHDYFARLAYTSRWRDRTSA
ncbi:hypothetical protein [Mycobacterium sp. IDR2000157661]|uniref:hypothetical protein n=1 Tax=Mycobacterium sp. IDR2000157661 TaxID=2867005 RepID=UPI001EEA2A74|nr:hypothetical protein [Mycobacterium sp. IDR2000157661]ULE32733.1 hypothetical protein K3G64_22025 [Mycobacterium sp. IDR2000157661]